MKTENYRPCLRFKRFHIGDFNAVPRDEFSWRFLFSQKFPVQPVEMQLQRGDISAIFLHKRPSEVLRFFRCNRWENIFRKSPVWLPAVCVPLEAGMKI